MGGLGKSGRGLGRLGQGLEHLNCILDASWRHLRGFRRRLEVNLRRLGPQKTAQTLPNPLPNPVFKVFFGCFFRTPNLHRFFIGLSSIFGCFVIARNLDFRAPVEAKR